MTTTILADGAYTAGVLVGRLIPILLGALILAVGLSRRSRARRDAAPPRGGVAVVIGSVLLGLGVVGAVASSFA